MTHYPLNTENLLHNLKELLQIKSVSRDCGAVTPAYPLGEGIGQSIEYMLALGASFGMKGKNLDGYCGWLEAGTGEQLVAVLVHLDTVSVDENGWVAPPFDGTLIDGKLYGRGTADDKGPAIVSLYAMKTLADAGMLENKRVRLIFGGDEESGVWECMHRYKQTEEIPTCAFTPDARYPVTYAEKGILHIRISRTLDSSVPEMHFASGKLLNVVPANASATIDGKQFEADGLAAHAMEPHKGDNALLKLCGQLRKSGYEHPFLSLAKIADAKGLGIDFSDEPSGALTINPAYAAVNKASAELCCDLRIPVTIDKDRVLNAIAQQISPLGFSVETIRFTPPLYVPKDSKLVSTLQKVYLEVTGDPIPPQSTGGGTYARAFENAVAFGILFPDELATIHQTNEYWSLDSIEKNFQIIANAIAAL